MEKNCQRCFNRKAIFNCPSCDKYHNLCQNCDDYIHSLKNNKFHKRHYLNLSNENSTNNNILDNSQNEEINSSTNNINSLNNNSQLNISNNFNKKQFNTYPLINNTYSNNTLSEKENGTPSFYKFQTYYNNNKNIKNNIKDINSDKIINNTNYTESIKNQIEYIKKNMSEQINQILYNIDNNNKNMNYEEKLEIIEKKYQEQIAELMRIKNEEINNLEFEINEANKTNESLINEISKENENNNIKIIELTNIINSLTDELNHKDEQILMLKGNTKKNENILQNEFEDEKDNICNEYEKKINNILNISEHNQQKLMSVIREKDEIINNLINCNQNKNKEFNEFIQKINEDNKRLKNITEQSIGLAKYNLVNSMNNNNSCNFNNYNNYNNQEE